MTAPVIVLDAGVLDLATTNERLRDLLRDLVAGGWKAMIPTVVLAEAFSGQASDAPVSLSLKRFGTVVTDEAMARRAGRLRHGVERTGVRRIPSGIDAIVAAHASQNGRGLVVTTDAADMERLLADYPNVSIKRV